MIIILITFEQFDQNFSSWPVFQHSRGMNTQLAVTQTKTRVVHRKPNGNITASNGRWIVLGEGVHKHIHEVLLHVCGLYRFILPILSATQYYRHYCHTEVCTGRLLMSKKRDAPHSFQQFERYLHDTFHTTLFMHLHKKFQWYWCNASAQDTVPAG